MKSACHAWLGIYEAQWHLTQIMAGLARCYLLMVAVRVFTVDWKPELTYANSLCNIQLSSSNQEVSDCTM